jgi:putative intracellular protease/amidase
MKIRFLLLLLMSHMLAGSYGQHAAANRGNILMIVSNPSTNKQIGIPIGAWYAEVTHPYWEFSEAGYAVHIASPEGGEIKFDAYSDPEHESRYSEYDYVSLGFKKDTSKIALTKNTIKLSTVNPGEYKAIFVCGGMGPMYTFIDNTELHNFFATFYLTGKPAAAICHGTCILLRTKLPNGKFLVDGKKWTGFAASEEQEADDFVGKKIQPFRIEDEARKMPNSKFIRARAFQPFAIADGNLITGQQQYSGAAAARLVIAELEKRRPVKR